MKMLFAAAVAAVFLLVVPTEVSAQSNDAILQRLAALEKENASLRQRVQRLETKSVSVAPAAVAAPLASSAATYAMASAPAAALARAMPFDWSGLHAGLFSSYALGHWRGTATDYPHQSVNGWAGGVAIGYDYMMTPNWLIGIEGDLQAADVERTDNYIDVAATLRLDYLATLRGRIGYAWDRNLIYLTGGLAAGHLKLTFNQYHPAGPASPPFQTSAEGMHYGYAVGGGWQWAFTDNASLKFEYLWVDLPERGYVFPQAPGFTGDNSASFGWTGHVVKAGVNWQLH
jgi:outer membrane immunogenic protein